MKHPADSLYYLDINILVYKRACAEEVTAWCSGLEAPDYYAPVTFEKVMQQASIIAAVSWALNIMQSTRKITPEEWLFAYRKLSRLVARQSEYTDELATLILMDTLLIRAQREGRVP